MSKVIGKVSPKRFREDDQETVKGRFITSGTSLEGPTLVMRKKVGVTRGLRILLLC